MNNIKTLLIRKLFPKLLRMKCPYRIPRSGKEGEAQNCFSISIKREHDPFFLVDGLNERCFKGKIWNGTIYKIDASIPLSLLNFNEIEIRHYYGLSTIIYSGLWDYLINGLTKKEYIKIFFSKIWQYYFNTQKLVMIQRHELLKVLIDYHIKANHKGINLFELMTKLYSKNWIDHPKGSEQKENLTLYVESLVDSGDLSKSNMDYFVNSKAILTIAKFEEEERRHMDIVKLQKKMVIFNGWLVLLTICIVFFAMIQAGVIKLPLLLDLSRKG